MCDRHSRFRRNCALCQSIARAASVARVIEAEDNPILEPAAYAVQSAKPMHRETVDMRAFQPNAFAAIDGRRTRSVEAILQGWAPSTPPEIIRATELRIAFLRPPAKSVAVSEPETWSEWRSRTHTGVAFQRVKGAYLPMRVHNDAHGAAQAWYAKQARG